jgi:outer membrane immunogenic protein
MKKVTAAMAGVALLAGSMLMVSGAAFADGVDRKSAKDDVVVAPPVYRWGGLYAGAHLGGAWTDVDWRAVRSPWSEDDEQGGEADEVAIPDGTRLSRDIDGFIGGGHIGIQHQFGRWVFGVEASLSGGQDLEARNRFIRDTEEDDELQRDIANVKTDLAWLILGTARLGYTWDRWMAYVRGGYAQARIQVQGERFQFEDDEQEKSDRFASARYHQGWTIGAGVEYLLMPNVTLGLEYNYIDLNAKTHHGTVRASETICDDADVCVTEFEARRHVLRVDPDAIHTLWARLSFKLNREVPVEPLK